MRIVRADERYFSAAAGIESWHCFSASGHYDADNVSYGALIGCDEHLIAPGAGFDWHGHRDVDIVSWVLAGSLRHEDAQGSRVVRPGEVLRQATGSGIRHRETNASSSQPLRLVQMTLLSSAGAQFAVWESCGSTSAPLWHVFVGAGRWRLDDESLEAGDSARGAGELAAAGEGQLLVWLL